MMETALQLIPHAPLPRWRLDPEARYRFGGRYHRLAASADGVHTFRETEEPYDAVSLTEEEFQRLHDDANLSIDPRYFSRQKAYVRSLGNASQLSHAKPRTRTDALFQHALCQGFEKAQGEFELGLREGPVNHGKPCLDALLPRLAMEVIEAWNVGARKGEVLLFGGLKHPSARHFTRLYRKYELARHPAAFLRKEARTSSRRWRTDAAELQLRIEAQRGFASENRPKKADCYRTYRNGIHAANTERKALRLVRLRPVDRKTFNAGIDRFCPFWVHEQRYDRKSALAKYAGGAGGFEAFRPGERIELDEWKIDLVTLLIYAGVYQRLNDAERAAVSRARLWASVALEAASRVVLAAIVHARPPNAETAVELLELAVSNKAGMAAYVGARCSFPYAVSPEYLLPDNGSGFRDELFHAAGHDIGAEVIMPEAGRPKARAHIERAFRTFSMQALADFSGRTYSNVVEKEGEDAAAKAKVTADAFAKGFFRHLIDHYNHSRHSALGGLSPHDCWMKMTQDDPPLPPPTEDHIRQAFGLQFQRVVSKDGVRFLGIQYNSPEVQEFFGKKLKIRIARLEMSVVCFWNGVSWIDVPSVIGIPRGISMYAVEHAWKVFNHRYDAREEMHMEHIVGAARELREIGEAADRMHRVDPLWDRGRERKHFDKLDRERFPYAIKWQKPASAADARLLDLSLAPDEEGARHYELPPGYRTEEPEARHERYDMEEEKGTKATDAPATATAAPIDGADTRAPDMNKGALDNPDDFEF